MQAAIREKPMIKELEHEEVQQIAVLKMARLLKQCLHLEHLTVRAPQPNLGAKEQDHGAMPASSGDLYVISPRYLQVLELVGLHLTPESLRVLGEGVAKNSSLTALCLNDSTVGDEGAVALTLAIREHRRLARLQICRCGLTDKGGVEIMEGLRIQAEALSLSAWKHSLRTAVQKGTASPPGVKVLAMSHNDLGGPTFAALASVIRLESCLQEIYLRGCRPSLAASAELQVVLTDSKEVQVLDVRDPSQGLGWLWDTAQVPVLSLQEPLPVEQVENPVGEAPSATHDQLDSGSAQSSPQKSRAEVNASGRAGTGGSQAKQADEGAHMAAGRSPPRAQSRRQSAEQKNPENQSGTTRRRSVRLEGARKPSLEGGIGQAVRRAFVMEELGHGTAEDWRTLAAEIQALHHAAVDSTGNLLAKSGELVRERSSDDLLGAFAARADSRRPLRALAAAEGLLDARLPDSPNESWEAAAQSSSRLGEASLTNPVQIRNRVVEIKEAYWGQVSGRLRAEQESLRWRMRCRELEKRGESPGDDGVEDSLLVSLEETIFRLSRKIEELEVIPRSRVAVVPSSRSTELQPLP